MSQQWKRIEKRFAEILGGVRVGVTGINTVDVITPLLAIETKHGKSIPKFVTDAFAQCKANNRESWKIEMVGLHATGSQDYLCVLELGDLAKLISLIPEGLTEDDIMSKLEG